MIPDAALGIPVGFDPVQFRTAIRFAMQMGRPNLEGRQVQFVKTSDERRYFKDDIEVFRPPTGTLRVDRDGMPLDPTVRVQQDMDEAIEIDVAIETSVVTAEQTPIGSFKPLRAEVIVLDEDYEKVKDCRQMRYNGDTYAYYQEPDTYGLFGVDVHPIIFFALDEGSA